MTDNEILKALECCGNDKSGCIGCTFFKVFRSGDRCIPQIAKKALDLINRQKAEVESLQDEVVIKTSMYNDMKSQRDKEHQYCMHYITMIAKAKTEGIKEFWNMLKRKAFGIIDPDSSIKVVDVADGDNLVKEMTEGVQE